MRRLLTAGALLASPALGALAARAAPMAVGLQTRWTMIDPTFYTAYAQHPADLMRRFGGADYYWVRLGFVVPAAITDALFGAVPGFVVLRYVFALLAVAGTYVLARRIASRAASWVGVVAVVTNPVLLTAWGSDYPDSAAVSYLAAAAACLATSARSPRERTALRVGGGLLLGLALNAHVAALPFVVALLVAVPIARRGRERWTDAGWALVGILVVTAALAALAGLLWGHADLVTPTVEQYLRLQRPDQIAIWHSATWDWARRATYLLVPPLLIGLWAATLRGRRPEAGERLLVIAAAAGLLLATWSQARGGASLEYFLYSSLLWWSVGPLLAVSVGRLTEGSPAVIRWGAPTALVAVTVAFAWLGLPVPRFTAWPVGVVLAVVVLAAVLAVPVAARMPPRRAAAPVVAGAVLLATVVLTIGQPKSVYAPGQAIYPLPDFSALGRLDTARARDVYRVVSQVPDVVPPASRPGETVVTWVPEHGFPGPPLDPIDQGAAQYPASRLASTLPVLTAADARRVDAFAPGTCVLLLSATGSEFPAAEAALARRRPEVAARTVLSSGTAVLHVEALRIGGR